jgi:hypothetical protein
MTGSPVLLLLYDHNQVMQHFGAMMPREVKAVLAAVGLDEVKSVGLRLGARGRALVGSLFVQTAGERRGLIKAMASAPVDPSLLRLAPRDASIAWASNLDGTELYDATLALIDAVAKAAEPGTNVPALVAQFEGKAGLSLRNDLFASLGRGTLVTTSGESLLPALIVSQAVKDPERFEGAVGKLVVQLDRLIKAHAEPAGAALKTIQFGKHTIRYLATPGVYLPLAPCFVRQGDRIIFALSPVHLKDYLAFLDAGEPSILDNPGYKELAALVPKNATSVSYSDFTESFIDVYTGIGPLLSLVQAIPGNPVPIDLANLPSARTIRKPCQPRPRWPWARPSRSPRSPGHGPRPARSPR